MDLSKKIRIYKRWIVVLMCLILLVCSVQLIAQQPSTTEVASKKSDILDYLPAITFLITIGVGILNLYVINKLNKSKEDILSIVRSELKEEIKTTRDASATKEQLDFLRKEMTLTLTNIEYKIDNLQKKL